ncbi:Ff.00g003380.m01.CDS01 [Fusarium sp. VM40]|nr:Ff.00g003380.m01.CDS01 [Fusarium sp. VM40]
MNSPWSVVGPLLLGAAQLVTASPARESSVAADVSASLNWAACKLDLPDVAQQLLKAGDCATIEVPLDYTNPNSKKTVELQLLRFKATKKPFKGTVFWNPGGPGISGIETLAYLGQDFRNIMGGHNDIISFDPRGVGRTIPFACNTSSTSAELARRSQKDLPQADLWEYVKNEGWARMQAVAEACYETQQENGRFLSTAFTARDMIKIVDALKEDGKLRYWGISYGTILGQVAATLFPDRIDRLLLDSNSLADAYFKTTGAGGPADAEKSLVHLFTECIQLGTKTCKLADYSGSKTTVQNLRDATATLFQKLKDMKDLPEGLSPEQFPYAGNSILKQLKYGIMNYLSSPSTYPAIVEILSYAFAGDYKKALSIYVEEGSDWNLGTNAFQGIACSEAEFRAQKPEDLRPFYNKHLAESSFGDAIAADYVACGAWKFKAAEGFDTDKFHNVKTKFPALIVNGAFDPITSLGQAQEVASRFTNGRFLVHEGVGHGVTSHASNCTLDAIAAYFVDGTLPKVGTRCKPNMLAFEYAKKLAG